MTELTYSFSLIDTFKQCPRKFYYSYIERLPSKPSIHFERGKILHYTVKRFFESVDPESDLEAMKRLITNILQAYWNQKREILEKLEVENLDFYLEESKLMAENWATYFYLELKEEVSQGFSFQEAFERITPVFEVKYHSFELSVKGFLDAIKHKDGEVEIIDFKTSKTADVEKYKLQMGIYSLLYQLEHGTLPNRASLFFFKHGKRAVSVNEALVEEARREISSIKEKTQSKSKKDYPKCVTRLCKWSTGSCDFFDLCFSSQKDYEQQLFGEKSTQTPEDL